MCSWFHVDPIDYSIQLMHQNEANVNPVADHNASPYIVESRDALAMHTESSTPLPTLNVDGRLPILTSRPNFDMYSKYNVGARATTRKV